MKTTKMTLLDYYGRYLSLLWRKAPFVLRITEWKGYPVPVMVVKERQQAIEELHLLGNAGNPVPKGHETRMRLVERGHLAGEAQRRCLPVLRRIVNRVCDNSGIPLELARYLTKEGLRLRLNLALDEEAGAKLGLIFRLQERIADLDRVELIARRVDRFTREEAVYWFSRTTTYGPDANRWAVSGLRTMLGGQANDPGVERVLEKMRDG